MTERAELYLTRSFAAPREQVFDAWTDAEVLRRWWAARPEWDSPSAEVDLRLGGRYRLSMRDTTTGRALTVAGEYTEIRRPERLAYTWTWEDRPEEMRGSDDTLVVVDFVQDGAGTTVVLTHSGFADPIVRDQHADGWKGCLDNLARRVLQAPP